MVWQKRSGILFTPDHPLENILNIRSEVQSVHLAALLERVHEGQVLGCPVTPCEQPGTTAHRDVTEAPLDGIVVYLYKPVPEERLEGVLVIENIIK